MPSNYFYYNIFLKEFFKFVFIIIRRFHTNSNASSASANNDNDENQCVLCLCQMETINIKKICNACMTKHNFSLTKNQLQLCNLCKQNIEGEKFQDHLIEHEFENESISCVICNAIFSTINGLKEHLREHKLSPSDFKEACGKFKCNARFLFSSELQHHTKEHEIVENEAKSIKLENNDDDDAVMKDEEEDDYIEIEKVPEN